MEPESFRLLGESADVRVGVRQQGEELGIEVLVRLSSPELEFRPGAVRSILDRLDALCENGYRLTAQDGWWVVCEKAVTVEGMDAEESFALRLFADLLGGP